MALNASELLIRVLVFPPVPWWSGRIEYTPKANCQHEILFRDP